jgi:hypothetical protein
MFIENKYKQWHDNIITKAKNRTLIGYKEVHHILPKSLGGSNDKSNLVQLTAREHFIVHMLLCKFTKGQARHKMIFAFNPMANIKSKGRNYKTNSKTAELLRLEFKKLLTGRKLSKEHIENLRKSHLGIRPSKETRLKMSKVHKGNKYCLGKKASKKTKEKLSNMRKGSVWVNNNLESKRIKKDQLQNYLNIGYKLGRDKSYLTKEYSLKMSKLTQSYWDRRSA